MTHGFRRILVGISEPGKPNRNLLKRAARIAVRSGARLYLIHTYATTPSFEASGALKVSASVSGSYETAVRRQLERLAAPPGLDDRILDVAKGLAKLMRGRLARRMSADVLVMGAVSRTGLDRLFVGRTAERVIDRVHCEVLVIKPAAFRSAVPRRTRTGGLALP